jgi:hypothetical protein
MGNIAQQPYGHENRDLKTVMGNSSPSPRLPVSQSPIHNPLILAIAVTNFVANTVT